MTVFLVVAFHRVKNLHPPFSSAAVEPSLWDACKTPNEESQIGFEGWSRTRTHTLVSDIGVEICGEIISHKDLVLLPKDFAAHFQTRLSILKNRHDMYKRANEAIVPPKLFGGESDFVKSYDFLYSLIGAR